MTEKLRDLIVDGEKSIQKISSLITRLKKNGVNIFDVNYEGEIIPTLHLAASADGKGDIIEKLIKEGADIERMRYQPFNVKNEDYTPKYNGGDCTALGYAVLNENYKAVKMLLNLDADPNGRSDTLDTPVIYSTFIDNIDIARKFTLLLVSWEGRFIKNDLENIIIGDYKKIKSYVPKNVISKFKYEKDYFFNGDKKERKEFLTFIEEVFEETEEIMKKGAEKFLAGDEEEEMCEDEDEEMCEEEDEDEELCEDE